MERGRAICSNSNFALCVLGQVTYLSLSFPITIKQVIVRLNEAISAWCTLSVDYSVAFPTHTFFIYIYFFANSIPIYFRIIEPCLREFPVRTWCFHCHGPGSIRDWGTKILQATWHSQKKKTTKEPYLSPGACDLDLDKQMKGEASQRRPSFQIKSLTGIKSLSLLHFALNIGCDVWGCSSLLVTTRI